LDIIAAQLPLDSIPFGEGCILILRSSWNWGKRDGNLRFDSAAILQGKVAGYARIFDPESNNWRWVVQMNPPSESYQQ
jgi:hypothetical protein